MEQKSNSIWKSGLIYGLYLGIISVLISVVIWAGSVMESMGIFGSLIIITVILIITFLLLLFFTKAYRNKELGGFISFGKAFQFAIIVVLISTIISSIYNYIFYTIIDPGYMENLMAVMQQKTIQYLEKVGAPESRIDKTLEKFEDIPTLWESIKKGILNGVIGGAILSLIVGAIVKKKEELVVEE